MGLFLRQEGDNRVYLPNESRGEPWVVGIAFDGIITLKKCASYGEI
jgi:hypothetical protein